MEPTTFESLPIPEPILRAIQEAGFTHCTPIQSKTLPISLSGKDVAGQAQTGTGKTAAFLITLLTRLLNNKSAPAREGQIGPRALAIAPTRELARQIEKDAIQLGRHCGLRIVCVYGGCDYEKQKNLIKNGVDILIGTPGRLLDYYKQKFFSLKLIEVLVVDEADRMFDMGFISDLRYIFRNTTPYNKRLTMLFSATLNHRVMELCYEHMNNPERVAIEPEKAVVDLIKQVLYHVGRHEKFSLLLGLLKQEAGEKVLIFCNTKHEAEKLEARLRYNDYDAGLISGDLPQNARIRILEKFQSGDLYILIATDVASRGLHISDITHVINYDVPQDAEDYVHRIGRTARAGAKGDAITLCCENYAEHLERVEDYIRTKIPVVWPDDALFIKERPGKAPLLRKARVEKPKKSSDARSGSGKGRSGSGNAKNSRRPRRNVSRTSSSRPSS